MNRAAMPASGMVIHKYCTRPFAGNAVHTPVHVFATPHDRRTLSSPKRHLSTTLYPSLAKPGVDGYQMLIASSNDVVSEYIELVGGQGCSAEVVPLATAKHMADMMGVGLAVASSVYCDRTTGDVWYDLYTYQPEPAWRDAKSRELLRGALAAVVSPAAEKKEKHT